jgi:hypothetical protein
MRVRIFHTDDLASAYDTDGPGTGLREVFSCDEPDPAADSSGTENVPEGVHLAILERMFFLFNVGDDPAFGTPDPRAVAYRRQRLRSLSMGDVVALDDVFYACASVGWKRLDPPPEIVDGGSDSTPPSR